MGKVSTNRQKVPMARRLVTSSMSGDYDVMLVTSQCSSKWSHSETKTWSTICADP